MDLTPMAERPIRRILSSWKRMDIPWRVPSSSSRVPSVSATPISSSSSRSVTAIRPLARMFENSESAVLFDDAVLGRHHQIAALVFIHGDDGMA